jgi:hypothetical protein
MARIVRTSVDNVWGPRIRAMIEDGRLVFDTTVNGKRLYKLDRKKLGMPEYEDAPKHVQTLPNVPEEDELDDLKVEPVKLKKTLEAKMKRLTAGKVKRVTPAIHA